MLISLLAERTMEGLLISLLTEPPYWSYKQESNPQSTAYKAVALPFGYCSVGRGLGAVERKDTLFGGSYQEKGVPTLSNEVVKKFIQENTKPMPKLSVKYSKPYFFMFVKRFIKNFLINYVVEVNPKCKCQNFSIRKPYKHPLPSNNLSHYVYTHTVFVQLQHSPVQICGRYSIVFTKPLYLLTP